MKHPILESEPRAGLVRLWLKQAADDAKAKAVRVRSAYEKPYMAEACVLMADTYARAADVFESTLAELEDMP